MDSRLQRVEYQLRTEGGSSGPADKLLSGLHSRGYLPHVKREGASYFVTFRLADSLPREVLLALQCKRAERFHVLEARKTQAIPLAVIDKPELIERDYRRELERFLDRGAGACWLRRPEIAGLTASAIRHFDGERYVLGAWVVMPNHVHMVLWPKPNHRLSDILHSIKRFAAREANRALGRVGKEFWQRESYDHWIRNDEETASITRYVTHNPVNAGLCQAPEDWAWGSAFHPPS